MTEHGPDPEAFVLGGPQSSHGIAPERKSWSTRRALAPASASSPALPCVNTQRIWGYVRSPKRVGSM